MLELTWIVIIGAVVGALAKFVIPGTDPGGIFVTTLLGMGGALVATLLGPMRGLAFSPPSSERFSSCSSTGA